MVAKVSKFLWPLLDVVGLVYGSVFTFLFFHGTFFLKMLPACQMVNSTIQYVQCAPDTPGSVIAYAYLYISPLIMQLLKVAVFNVWNAGAVPTDILVHSVGMLAGFAIVVFAALRMAGLALHGILADHYDKAPLHRGIFRAVVLLAPTIAFVVYRIIL